ncbi:MAG: hypothetical protein Fur0037_18410 [Planctomycetota bacterium]
MTASTNWLDFTPETLKSAETEDRLVLMVITVPWCRHCKELLTVSFEDPKVKAQIGAHFVPVLVDAERRPDVNGRYGTGGWPSIAWLTPKGDLIANDQFLTAERLAARLERIHAYWRDERASIEQGISRLWTAQDERGTETRGKLSRQIVEDVVEAIYGRFDHRYGGWGDGAKFPHPDAIDFAMVQVAKRGDERMSEVVTVTLDRMMESPIHDRVGGGFFRFSKTPDWRSPNHEKLLDVNAKMMRAYLEAYQLQGKEAYRRTAEGIASWMLGQMLDPVSGAFFGSQDADSDYYNLDASERARREPPARDRTIYTNSNALAVSNLLKGAAVLGKPEWRDHAMRALTFLRENLFDDREVYHYWDGTYHLPGMLSDQAYLMRALIDASQHTGDSDLLLPAESIAERAIERQQAPGGGFYDILHDPRSSGSMRRRNRSILENAVIAEALVRLSYLSRRPEFYDQAIRTLEAFANDYKEYGYYLAGFGRTVDLIFYEPLFLTIVGDRDSSEAEALRRAALSTYVPSRIVQMLDPAHDPILIGRSGYAEEDRPVVYITVGKSTRSMVHTPEELKAAVEEIEWQRRSKLR